MHISDAVPTSTHNLCSRAKIKKKQIMYMNLGCEGVLIARACTNDERRFIWELSECVHVLASKSSEPGN